MTLPLQHSTGVGGGRTAGLKLFQGPEEGAPPCWDDLCEAKDQRCQRCYETYLASPDDTSWLAYLDAKHSRAAVLA